jgi:hypothetical protein
MKVPKQYHIAREKQVYSVFFELVPVLKKLRKEEEIKAVKQSVFNNVMLGSFDDNRKYIRDVKSMIDTGVFSAYMKQQMKIGEEIEAKKNGATITNMKDLDEFIKENKDSAEDLKVSLESSLLQSKKQETKSKPAQIVNKSVSMLMGIDTRIVEKLNDVEKDKLKEQISKLKTAIRLIDDEEEEKQPTSTAKPEKAEEPAKGFATPISDISDPIIYPVGTNTITSLGFTVNLTMLRHSEIQPRTTTCLVYFVDEQFNALCSQQQVSLTDGIISKVSFQLSDSSSKLKECYLVIKAPEDNYNEARQLIRYNINITFSVDFDF